jgi:glucose-1-phosphate thymidylyltransferase
VNVLLLAAGYATRLGSLTRTTAKPLLPVGGRPMADWILDAVHEVPELQAVHLVTNAVYADSFATWGQSHGVTVHNDGTRTNEGRLGAIGDMLFAIEHGDLFGDDLLVIAADNLFDFSVVDYIEFWRDKGGSALAVHRLADPSLAPLYGVVELGADDRVIGLEEKPVAPKSDLVSTATYLLSREHLELLQRYLDEGNPPDPPGKFLVWLYEHEPVYGFRFAEAWLDIGDPAQLLAADNLYRERAGLPARSEYTP